jgi:hypothetical protein
VHPAFDVESLCFEHNHFSIKIKSLSEFHHNS